MIRFILFPFLICLLLSCDRPGEKGLANDNDLDTIKVKAPVSYQLFHSGKGYGFNILKDGHIYIHQPIVPCIRGLHAFANYLQAKATAELIIRKMNSGNFNFLLQKFEMDSLLRRAGKSFQAEDENGLTFINQEAADRQATENSHWLISKTFPQLTDEPLKKKWTAKEHVPFGYRGGCFSFAIGKFVFIGSGEYHDAIIKDFWCYNTHDNVWTCLAEIPSGCFSGAAFSIFNKGYAGLGTEIGTSSGKFKKHMYQYDPATNSWTRLKDFPGTERIDPSVFVIANKAYIGTGYDGSNTRDFYEYDPKKDQWKRIADFPGGDLHASIGIGTGKRGFMVAGARAPIDFKFVYEYIPGTNKWEQRQDIPGYARNFLSGCYIDSNHIIAGSGGSYEDGKRLRDFYVYDIAKNKWSNIPDYPISNLGNSRPCGANVEGKIFMGTGFNTNFLNDWNVFEYYYNVRTDTGDYNETTSYPLKYNGQWQLFQECNIDDCFAGVEVKSSQQLGNFCYSSRYEKKPRTILLKDEAGKKLFLFQRNFAIKTDNQPKAPVSLRLFFTKDELETALNDYNKKTGLIHTLDDLQVLQCNESNPDTDLSNNSLQKNTYSFIRPQWYSYGFNGETLVAEFPVTSLHSEFYLILSTK